VLDLKKGEQMRRLIGLCAALAVLVLPLRAPAGYLVTPLGNFEPAALNNAGQVVGTAFNGINDAGHATLYSGGKLTDLGIFDATAINNSGQVVGINYSTEHAVQYSGGVTKDLGTFGGWFGTASGINDAGQIVGGNGTLAVLYSGGVAKSLGSLAGGSGSSDAAGINASGLVVGTSDTSMPPDPSNALHAVLFTPTLAKDLGTLGGKASYGYAINASGQAVGKAQTASGEFHPFLYSGGVMKDLGSLGGTGLWSTAHGINASGQVVGDSYTAGNVQHAFLYSGGKLTDLNGLLPPGYGITLVSAVGINDRGQIAALSAGGRAYLLTPVATPEPGGLTLLTLGAAGLLACGWRRTPGACIHPA
jgi:probable HAF family extracellular repeat protein